jgi:predicted phage baseplate assembly protein
MSGATEPLVVGQASRRGLNDCDCGAGLTAQTPAEVKNRPGLSAIAYRVGIHSQFKHSMLARLSAGELASLAQLQTRADDDFSIALLDAWATVADVLTFYQERIANESYLRTATERRSLLELARLIGYELRPGVAASTYLAFTVEDAPGSPPQTSIDIGTKVQSVPGPGEKPQTFETIEKIEARPEWSALKPQIVQAQQIKPNATTLYLKGINTQLQPGDAIAIVGNERETNPNSTLWAFRLLQSVTTDVQKNVTQVTWQETLTLPLSSSQPAKEQVKVYALRQRAALFGHNAPEWGTMPTIVKKAYKADATDDPNTWGSEWPGFSLEDNQLDLDATYAKITLGSWVVVTKAITNAVQIYKVNGVTGISRAQFGLSAKITRITPDKTFTILPLRFTTAFAQSELLEMAEEPLATPIEGDTVTLARTVDGLNQGRLVVVSGKESTTGDQMNEVVAVLKAEPSGVGTKLFFTSLSPGTPALVHRYTRDTVTINANVARATHGETVQELLGSGDASQPYQRFLLRQPPLTYVSASTPSGAESTLQVRVNDLLWREVPTLYGHGPNDHVFITRTDDEGKTTVQGGDGVTGARLPSGQNNVQATYRKGIGLEGLVKAEQLSLLLTRPLGVKAVTNPLPATGADDRESLLGVRGNAPLTVLTLDRIVSLQDYEDFARTYAGIAKALATWTWENQTRRVFVTVAGPNGAEVTSGSELYKNLLAAMQKAGDPYVELRVKSYRSALFRITGSIIRDPEYQPQKVLAAVEQTLRAQFSFDARTFGQPVMLSEVIAAVQAVPGVIAVDIDKLYRTDQAAVLHPRLLAELPIWGAGGEMLAAELLTLDPGPLTDLTVRV